MLAGLALLKRSLGQARSRRKVTASGLTLVGIGSAFWGLIAGGVGYVVLNLIADRNRY